MYVHVWAGHADDCALAVGEVYMWPLIPPHGRMWSGMTSLLVLLLSL